MAAPVENIGAHGDAPKDPRRRLGDRGEDLAISFFLAKGFRVLHRNWSCRLGEIDLICELDGVVHFVEVKTRRSMIYGHPEEAVTPKKLHHLRRTIEVYLTQQPADNYQIDVLAILAEPGKPPQFHYVENI